MTKENDEENEGKNNELKSNCVTGVSLHSALSPPASTPALEDDVVKNVMK